MGHSIYSIRWLICVSITIACFSVCTSAEAYHWNPDNVDESAGVYENLWGYFSGISVAVNDELAAFTLAGDVFVGWFLISTADQYGFMDVWATNTTVVYFLVWDASEARQIRFLPNYVISNAQAPPGGGPTQHNLGAVPEPPGIILLIFSLGLIWYFFFRPKSPATRHS